MTYEVEKSEYLKTYTSHALIYHHA